MQERHEIITGNPKYVFDEESRKGVPLVLENVNSANSVRDRCLSLTLGEEFIYCVNASRVPLGLFLKVLESSTVLGRVIFYGLSLAEYPSTILSRCEVRKGVTNREIVEEHAKDKPELSRLVEGAFYFHCQGSGVVESFEIVKLKESFVDFMRFLDSSTEGDYVSLLMKIRLLTEGHKHLFKAWMNCVEVLFKYKELELCPFIRGYLSKDFLDSWLRTSGNVEQLFVYLFSMKMDLKGKEQ
jgi:hypothetical protein